MVQHYNGRPIESRVWSIERRHFQWPWTTHTPSFKVTPFFDAEYLINGTTYRHSFNEIPILSFRMTLSDLAKHSVTWSVTWSLCDSWALCYYSALDHSVLSRPSGCHRLLFEENLWLTMYLQQGTGSCKVQGCELPLLRFAVGYELASHDETKFYIYSSAISTGGWILFLSATYYGSICLWVCLQKWSNLL